MQNVASLMLNLLCNSVVWGQKCLCGMHLFSILIQVLNDIIAYTNYRCKEVLTLQNLYLLDHILHVLMWLVQVHLADMTFTN